MRLQALALALLPALAGAANGVPQSGYPNWAERVVLVYSNRARADPAADLAGCGAACGEAACYAPVAPMGWVYELDRSARFHAQNLVQTGSVLQHYSPCTLVSNVASLYPPGGTCDASAACACQGGTAPYTSGCQSGQPCGTDPFVRIGMFGGSGTAENAAMGYGDPVQTFYQWLWEPYSSTACGFSYQNGHRYSILNGGNGGVGVGQYTDWWVMDFAGGASMPSPLVAGAHTPQAGGGSVEFRANWYDPSGGAPQSARVNVDGACTAMAVERGTGGNATWLAAVSVPSGCHRYAFEFETSGGTAVVLPEQGSYGVGDPASCADWDSSGLTSCAGVPPAPDAGPPQTDAGFGADAGSGGGDAGPATDAGAASGADGGARADAGPRAGGLAASGGCGCGAAGAGLLALFFAAAARRRSGPRAPRRSRGRAPPRGPPRAS